MRARRILPTLIGAVLLASPAYAANTSAIGQVEAYPTLTSIGLYADISGDDNGNANAWVEYREAGTTGFVKGHALMRIAAGRWAGAIFFLSPSKSYDVRVVLDDSDNGATATQDATATTRADQPPAASGATIWVDAANGNDTNSGSQAAPLGTIQAAADKALAGDTVRVNPAFIAKASRRRSQELPIRQSGFWPTRRAW